MSSSAQRNEIDEEAEEFADFDSKIQSIISKSDGFGVSSKRLGAIGDIFLIFLSQSTSNMINDVMTTLGLDGRLDILILLIALTISAYWLYGYNQEYIYSRNRKDKIILIIQAVMSHKRKDEKARKRFYSNIQRNRTQQQSSVSYNHQDDITSKYVILKNLSENYIMFRHQFAWRRFVSNFLEFFTMVCGILMTYYTQKCLHLFISNLNVSIYTMLLPAVIFFIYFVAFKSEFIPYNSDIEFDRVLTAEEISKYVDQQQ